MKKLLLIRHAHARNHADTDFERKLSDDGIHDAEQAAQALLSNKIIPQLIVTSPANRAKKTAKIIAEALGLTKTIKVSEIYEASENTLLKVINHLPDEYDFVALAGHNPGISQILYYLTGEVRDVPTCTVALVSFEADHWQEISEGLGKLTWYHAP